MHHSDCSSSLTSRFARHRLGAPTVALPTLEQPVLDSSWPNWRTLGALILVVAAAGIALNVL